jgi:hypothetical protein
MALALVLAAGNSSQAGSIPFTFTATVAFPQTGFGATADYNAPGGNGAVPLRLTGLSGSGNAEAPGTNVVTARLSFGGALPANSTDIGMVAYAISLLITDTDSKKTGSLEMRGTLTGTAGNNQANIMNTFNKSGGTSGNMTETTTIGDFRYTLNWTPPMFGTYTAPGTTTPGQFGAHLVATAVPEPASVALLGLGVAGATGFYRLRRKRSAA